jgi:signal transduction histidine kinase
LLKKNPKLIFARIVIIFSLIAILFASSIIIFKEQKFYNDRIKTSKENASMVAAVLADYVEVSLLFIDLFLQRFVEKTFEHQTNQIPLDDLNLIAEEAPYISAVVVTDKYGQIKFNYNKKKYLNKTFAPDKNLATFKPFLSHTHHTNSQLKLDSFTDPATQHEFLVISHRINNVDNEFNGIAFALVDSDYLQSFFSSVEIGNKTEMVLLMDSGELLFSSPDISHELDVMKYINKDSLLHKSLKNPTITKEHFINDYLHVFSFKHLSYLPLSVALITFEGDVLKNWLSSRDNLILFLLLSVTLASIIVFFASTITKRLKEQQNLEKLSIIVNKHRYEFIAKAIDEMKIPLNAIIAFADMLLTDYLGKLNQAQRERLLDILTCSTYVLDINNFLIRLSKDDLNKLILTEENVSLKELVGKALIIINQPHFAHGTEVICDDSLEQAPLIRADSFKILQILVSLIKKLLKYSPIGSAIRISSLFDDKGNLVIKIANKAIFITNEEIETSWSLTESVENINLNDTTNIGMALSKTFTDLHQGSLSYKIITNEGMEVLLIIPHERIIKI